MRRSGGDFLHEPYRDGTLARGKRQEGLRHRRGGRRSLFFFGGGFVLLEAHKDSDIGLVEISLWEG